MDYEKTNWTSTTPMNAFNLNKIENGIANMVNVIYPVGSIYMSIDSTSPETLFGGTWEQIKDTFLLSAGDTYEAGATGGEAEHTLTIEEIPEHTHRIPKLNYTAAQGSTSIEAHYSSDERQETSTTGGGKAHNNMPPYLTVYMWKRTS